MDLKTMPDEGLRRYEGIFIFSGTLEKEAIEKALEGIREEIEKAGGSINNIADMGKQKFARQLGKQESGNYNRIVFDLNPDKMAAFKGSFKFRDDILRIQIVKKENKRAQAPDEEGE